MFPMQVYEWFYYLNAIIRSGLLKPRRSPQPGPGKQELFDRVKSGSKVIFKILNLRDPKLNNSTVDGRIINYTPSRKWLAFFQLQNPYLLPVHLMLIVRLVWRYISIIHFFLLLFSSFQVSGKPLVTHTSFFILSTGFCVTFLRFELGEIFFIER